MIRRGPSVDRSGQEVQGTSAVAGLGILEANHAVQRSHGAAVILLSSAELGERFPWLHTADLAGGSLGLAGEGWIDPFSLLMAFKHRAQSLGAAYLQGDGARACEIFDRAEEYTSRQ